MTTALYTIFFAVVALIFFTTLAAVILAFRDMEGKSVAVTTCFIGLLTVGLFTILFVLALKFASFVIIICFGTFSLFAIFVLSMAHIMCAVISESEYFGEVAVVSDLFCVGCVIVMIVLI